MRVVFRHSSRPRLDLHRRFNCSRDWARLSVFPSLRHHVFKGPSKRVARFQELSMVAHRCVSPRNAFKRIKSNHYPRIQPKKASYLSTCSVRWRAEPTDGTQDIDVPQEKSLQTASSLSASREIPRDQAKDLELPREKSRILRPQDRIRNDLVELARARNIPLPTGLDPPSADLRLPRSVQALYLQPLRRTPTHGIPVANLQLRSFSIRNLEFVADLAVRTAYYLNLPAKGPVPLPRITERWTVPRSNFINKKSQENFERVTVRRLVQVLDGHPEVVQRWLAFVRKWSWYGVGMKADVFEYEGSDVGKRMDEAGDAVASGIEGVRWELFGRRRGFNRRAPVEEQLRKQGFNTPASDDQQHNLDTHA